MGNTGRKKYSVLIEYDGVTHQPTGVVKPNKPTDPDYVAPQIDYISCPVTSTTTTTLSNLMIQVSFPETMFTLKIRLLKDTTLEYYTTTEGTWSVPNVIYDRIIFEISGITAKYNIQVLYGIGLQKNFDIDNGQNWKVALDDNFSNITNIIVTKY